MFRFTEYANAVAEIMERDFKALYEGACEQFEICEGIPTVTEYEDALDCVMETFEALALRLIREGDVDIEFYLIAEDVSYRTIVSYTYTYENDCVTCNGFGKYMGFEQWLENYVC